MQLDPRVSVWLNVVYLVLTGLATGTLKLTGLVTGDTAMMIVAWAGVGAGVLNIVLHGVSAPTAGPMVGADPSKAVQVLALASLLPMLGACGTIKNPFSGGHFSNEVWKVDVAVIKDKLQKGGQAIRDTLDQLCPEIPAASSIVNDPNNKAVAAAYFGSQSATDKAVNNINDGLTALNDACLAKDVVDIRSAILVGAQAINDAKRIIASVKK